MQTDMNSYALQLVHVQEFACLLDLEERRDLVLWVLENEYRNTSFDDRFMAMMTALPEQSCDDVIIIETEEIPHGFSKNFGGCSNTPQLSLNCSVCGVAITDVLCLHCKSDGE